MTAQGAAVEGCIKGFPTLDTALGWLKLLPKAEALSFLFAAPSLDNLAAEIDGGYAYVSITFDIYLLVITKTKDSNLI